MEPPKVIYIGGHGRSGTTIADRVLAEVTSGFSAGEIHRFWAYGLARDWTCSCGATLRACEFWGPVLRQSFSKADVSEEKVLTAWKTVARPRSLLSLWYPRLRSARFRRRLARYRSFLEVLYRTVSQQSGTRVIVDSSGSPLHGSVLAGVEGVEVAMVHLVRDVRAVAFSNQRQKANPSAPAPDATMRTKSAPRVAATWMLYNSLLEGLEAAMDTYTFAKYEELFSRPKREFDRLAHDLGVESRAEEVFHGKNIRLSSEHVGQGNPVRQNQGIETLAPDTEWVGKLSRVKETVMAHVCKTRLEKYSYL
jgi:hypothetical protein